MLCALIMAGGKGTRFWPASTDEKPKQFLNLVSDKSMLQMTVERLLDLIPMDRIFVCTGEQYATFVQKQIPQLPSQNIIIEPTGRNTAPCILLSTLYINEIYKHSKIIVLPSDHVINNEREFLKILSLAKEYLDKNSQSILTIGITPNRPETGFGYIKCGMSVNGSFHNKIYTVDKFKEKPDFEKAKFYFNQGNYLWNAGMFLFVSDFMISQFKRYAFELYELLTDLPSVYSDEYNSQLHKVYEKCESISIDYAIIEKSNAIYVIPADFGWDDVGTWKALERYMQIDVDNNIINGKVLLENCENVIVYSTDKKIIIDSLSDIYCIQSGDYIIIGKKAKLDNVHKFRGI